MLSQTSEPPQVRVVAGVARRGRRVLAQQRPLDKARGGLWEFPGGKVEDGEADAVALQRELREELGVEVEVGTCIWHTEHTYPDLRVLLAVYAVNIRKGDVPRALQAMNLQWCDAETLQKLPFCPADADLIHWLVNETLPNRLAIDNTPQ